MLIALMDAVIEIEIKKNNVMTDKEIKFKVIKELNGIKSMSKQQVYNFIDYMFFKLLIEENSENKSIIIEGIQIYFKSISECQDRNR